jgi:hypothetical protein
MTPVVAGLTAAPAPARCVAGRIMAIIRAAVAARRLRMLG